MKTMLVNNNLKKNFKYKTDGLQLLSKVENDSIATAFFDPQYRGILDKLKYGNEGESRGKARCDLIQMSEEIIVQFVNELSRVIKNSGHLFLWIDKFHLCSNFLTWFLNTKFNLVDLIVWDKDKIGMGYRSRRKSEYLAVFQKSPVRAKDCWTLHNIPDVWTEKISKEYKNHPHSKPIELQKQLILATTKPGDIILDPAAGGFSVLTACQQLEDRYFIGGDILYGEN